MAKKQFMDTSNHYFSTKVRPVYFFFHGVL